MLRRVSLRAGSQLRASAALKVSQRASLQPVSIYRPIRQPVILSLRNFASDAKSETFLPVSEVTERVLSVVKSFEKVDPAKVKASSHFVNDLGLDSLDSVELVMSLEEEFVLTIPDDISEKILTCEDAIKFISQHPQAR